MTNDREHYLNHYNICVERMSRAAMLQAERRAMGWYGAALFYQFEAARWQRKAEQARADWTAAKIGEQWANDLIRDVMASYVPPRFEPADFFPRVDPVAFNADLYEYALTGGPIATTFGTLVDGTIDAPMMHVTTINRPDDGNARCSCGTLFEHCKYPDCNARSYLNR